MSRRVMSLGVAAVLLILTAACGASDPKHEPQAELADKVRLAQGYLRGGRTGPALEVMDQAIKMDPRNAGLRNLYGQICFVAGRLPEAEAAFDKALELDPYLTDARNNLGALYNETGRPAEAEREFLRALEDASYPTPQKIYFNLGVLYSGQGRKDEAVQSLRRAVQIERDYYRAHYELASLLDGKGQLEEAAREYEVAMPEFRNSGEFNYRLGFVYFRLGQHAKAEERLQRVLDLAPGSESAVRADEILKMIP